MAKKEEDTLIPLPTAVINEITDQLVSDFANDPAVSELSARTLARVLRSLQAQAGKYKVLEQALGATATVVAAPTPTSKTAEAPTPTAAPKVEAPKAPEPGPVVVPEEPAPTPVADDGTPETIDLDIKGLTSMLQLRFPGVADNPRELLVNALKDKELCAKHGTYNIARGALHAGL